MNKYTINDITRASGGFAMLAVDQREAMRMMFAAAGAPAPVADSVLTDFKVNAAKALSPYASAILVDQQFCYRQVVEQNAIAKSCAMIVAADEFIPGNGIPVDSVVIDRKINPLQIKQDGGKALKLLVLWRSDEDAQQRLDMVKEFNELCHSHGLVSIIEPVVRPPRRGDKFDREQAIIDAAKELGDSGADLYKVEMPLYGKGPQQELLCASQRLNDHIMATTRRSPPLPPSCPPTTPKFWSTSCWTTPTTPTPTIRPSMLAFVSSTSRIILRGALSKDEM